MTPTTLVTSMDIRFIVENFDDNGSDGEGQGEDRYNKQSSSSSLKLIVASGDSFHNVWVTSVTPSSVSNSSLMNNQSQQRQQHLPGHKGVVHDVKFSDCCTMLVSCSDDRSVRLWSRCPSPRYDGKDWKQSWVGWGRTARIRSVSFVFGCEIAADKDDPDSNNSSPQSNFTPSWVVSVSEDGTARFWDIQNGAAVVCIPHTSASSGLW